MHACVRAYMRIGAGEMTRGRGREGDGCREEKIERRKTEHGGRTFPTKSCVRVSRGGLVARGEAEEAMAIWMTASMSSFVGPEPAGGGGGGAFVLVCVIVFVFVFGTEEAGRGTSPFDEDEARVEAGRGRGGGGECAGVEAGWAEGGPEERSGCEWRGPGDGRGEDACYASRRETWYASWVSTGTGRAQRGDRARTELANGRPAISRSIARRGGECQWFSALRTAVQVGLPGPRPAACRGRGWAVVSWLSSSARPSQRVGGAERVERRSARFWQQMPVAADAPALLLPALHSPRLSLHLFPHVP